MEDKKITTASLVWMSAVVGIALVLSTAVGAYAFYLVRSFDNALTVTGSAKRSVTSDTVKWTTSFNRSVGPSGLQAGYVQMAKDVQIVKDFYKNNGIGENALTISNIFMEPNYDWNKGQTLTGYTLRQNVSLNSNDVAKITEMAKNTQAIINQGVVFSTQSLEYYYSKLADLRVDLLSDAVKDAKARASKLAESSGKQVGSLKSASSGVVQVLPVNSVAISDYGAYDTSSIEKEVMITVKALFTLK